MKEIGVGLLGYGTIGKMHAYACNVIPIYYEPFPARITLVEVCTASEATGKRAVEQAGFRFSTTNYEDLLKRKDINVISISTPNYLHREQFIKAIKAGKHVYCEKPLGNNLEDAAIMLKVAKQTNLKTQVAFMYRQQPALIRAHQLIKKGFLKEIFHFRAAYLHSGYVDTCKPLNWKMRMDKTGGGALIDMGSHVLDLLRWLMGDYKSVDAVIKTVINERPLLNNPKKKGKVEVDDLAIMQIEMKNGAIGTFEASRVATGTNDELRIEIHGAGGAVYFNLAEPNWLSVYDNTECGEPFGGLKGFKRIETVQRYPKPAGFPGPKFSVGWERYHIAALHNYFMHIIEDTKTSPDFYDGYKAQEILEAAYKSAKTGKRVKV